MKNKFKTFRTVKTVVCSFNPLPIFIFILGVFLSGPLQGQEETGDPCKENEFPFTGVPETTLCDELGGITYDLFIGVGTSITHSSQISPLPSKQIRIVGDFTIDNNFLLDLAVVKIDPGVSILMDANATLTIDNSKLFACTGMWNGIVMGDFTTVRTRNNTEIEDAEAAIQSVDKAYTFLEIENTTFNRDRIGMRLENSGISPHNPVVFVFRDNTFKCDAPLNGTVDEITETGVQIKNVYSAFLDNPSSTNNLFKSIQNGINIEGQSSDLNVYGFHFYDIHDRGINFNGRKLKVFDCVFDQVLRYGVYFNESMELDAEGNEFYIREAELDLVQPRHAIRVRNPTQANLISIGAGNYFYTEGIFENGLSRFIRIQTDGTVDVNAYISGCEFDVFNYGSLTNCVALDGNLTSFSDIEIFDNDFFVMGGNFFSQDSHQAVDLDFGLKHNVKIYGNTFQGGGAKISFKGSEGEGNEFSDNDLYQSEPITATGVLLKDFQNMNICSNENHAASVVAWLFNGANNGTAFSGNITFGGWQNSLWIAGIDPVIDQQIHTSNEWYPGLRPIGGGQFVTDHPFMEHVGTDEAQINLSKFFVHTEQSILNPDGQYDFFSEFHPFDIVPDEFPLEDVFFEFETGTPNIACLVQLTEPNGTDKSIADGTYSSLISSPTTAWDAERHLYQKLMSNPGYENAFAGFSTFLQSHATSNIGKFHQLQQKIYEAVALSPALKSEFETAKGEIADLDGQIKSAQSSGTLTGAMLDQYFNDRYALSQEIETVMGQYESHRSSKLSEAETILQGINTTTPHEGYRKTVFGIFIEAQLHQGGAYTAGQIARLKEVAMLCSGEAGMVTYVAQGLLPDCERAEIQGYIDACDPELEVEPRSSRPQNNEMLGGTPEKGFFFYPNPTSGQLVLSNHRGVAGVAEVFTPTGQLLKSRPLAEGEGFWDLGLPSGIYLLKVSFGDGETVTDRLIINR